MLPLFGRLVPSLEAPTGPEVKFVLEFCSISLVVQLLLPGRGCFVSGGLPPNGDCVGGLEGGDGLGREEVALADADSRKPPLADHPANGPDVIAVAGDQVGGGEVSIVIHNAGNSSRPFWSSPFSLRLGREHCRLYWAEPRDGRPGCDQRACRIALALSHPRGIRRSAVLGLESFHDR